MASMACRAQEAISGLKKASTSTSLSGCTRIEPLAGLSCGPRHLLTNLPGRQCRQPGVHMHKPAPGSCLKWGTDATAVRQYQSLQFPARCAMPCRVADRCTACTGAAMAGLRPEASLCPGRTTYMRPFSAETALRLLVAANAAVFCGWDTLSLAGTRAAPALQGIYIECRA